MFKINKKKNDEILNKDGVDETKDESHFEVEEETKRTKPIPLYKTHLLYRFDKNIVLRARIFSMDGTAELFLDKNGKQKGITGALTFDEIKNTPFIEGVLKQLKTKYKVAIERKEPINKILKIIAAKLNTILNVTRIKIRTDRPEKLDSDENKDDSKNIPPEENKKITSFEKEPHFDDKPETISDGEQNITTDNNGNENNIENGIYRKQVSEELYRKQVSEEPLFRKQVSEENPIESKFLKTEKSNNITTVASDIDTKISKENDTTEEIDNSMFSKYLSHSSVVVVVKDFSIVTYLLKAEEENNSSVLALMRKHLSEESIEILKAITNFEYFTENMIGIESNIQQRTVNNNLNSWVDIGLLKKKQDPIKYKIRSNVRPFTIFYWNDLPEPFPEIESQIIRRHQALRRDFWKTATPTKKMMVWVEQSYSTISTTRIRSTGRRIPNTPDEQRQLLLKKAERFGVPLKDKIFELLDYRTFKDFKEFRKQLSKLVTGHDLDIATDKYTSKKKRKKKKHIQFTCLTCNKHTYRHKQPEICPYDECEGTTFVENGEGE